MSIENETPEVIDLPKPSKLKRIKDAAIVAGFYGTTAVITGASLYYSVKMARMQLETAELNLENARNQLQNP